jgi:hypothetical protein
MARKPTWMLCSGVAVRQDLSGHPDSVNSGGLLDKVDNFLARARQNMVGAIPFIGHNLANSGEDPLRIIDPYQARTFYGNRRMTVRKQS